MSERLLNSRPRSAWYSPHTGSWACAYPLAEDARPSGMNRNHRKGGLASDR